jgi:hypothetical protein
MEAWSPGRQTVEFLRGVQTPGNGGTRDKTTEIFGPRIEKMNIKKSAKFGKILTTAVVDKVQLCPKQ